MEYRSHHSLAGIMDDTAARRFQLFVEELNRNFKHTSTDVALGKMQPGLDFASAVSRIAALRREASEELYRADFVREERREEFLICIEKIEKQLLNGICRRGSTSSLGPLLSDVHLEQLKSVADQMEEKAISKDTPPDRSDMMRETEALIAEIKTWNLDEYAQKTLLIQLNSIERIIQKADFYSSAELRIKVKCVIADFAIEFAAHDNAYQTHMERLNLWARKGFFAGSILLGLTADVSAVVALLPKP